MEVKKGKVYKIAKPSTEDDWAVKRDFDTLREAAKICADKSRHEKVLAYTVTLRKDAADVAHTIMEEKEEY